MSDAGQVFRDFASAENWDSDRQLNVLERFFGADAVDIIAHHLGRYAGPEEMHAFLVELVGSQSRAADKGQLSIAGAA
jgi:hypothetical protein